MKYKNFPMPDPLYQAMQKFAEDHFTATSAEELVLYLCRRELEKSDEIRVRIGARLQEKDGEVK